MKTSSYFQVIIIQFIFKLYFFFTQIYDFLLWILFPKRILKFHKNKVIKKNLLKNSIFIESGTYYGETVEKFSKNFLKCFSIEPSVFLYRVSSTRLKNIKKIKIINGTSENYFEKILLKNLNNDLTLFLDGHYSKGITFKNYNNSSLNYEINIIKKNILKFKRIVILIDDVDYFNGADGYPLLNDIKSYFAKKSFFVNVERNILIIRNH